MGPHPSGRATRPRWKGWRGGPAAEEPARELNGPTARGVWTRPRELPPASRSRGRAVGRDSLPHQGRGGGSGRSGRDGAAPRFSLRLAGAAGCDRSRSREAEARSCVRPQRDCRTPGASFHRWKVAPSLDSCATGRLDGGGAAVSPTDSLPFAMVISGAVTRNPEASQRAFPPSYTNFRGGPCLKFVVAHPTGPRRPARGAL